jgi:hypothetical protein
LPLFKKEKEKGESRLHLVYTSISTLFVSTTPVDYYFLEEKDLVPVPFFIK